ncbi:DUF6191 domain-containing protein [uncultured Friedmanniella sp.]|uniref:DUF6191 domain-containing protein n=1 Tax=uncultured Friedmanniella sp. TaxID=335381 RepID=UPI0035CA765C
MSFFEIFSPGLRHLHEERDRQNMLVSKPTYGGGAPLGIDLDAGVATIKISRPAPAPAVEEDGPADAAVPAAADPDATEATTTKPA